MRLVSRLMALILLSFTAASCYFGSNAGESSVARSPFGASVEFQFPGTSEVSGTSIRLDYPVELLLVSDDGLLVEADGHLVLVQFTSFETAKLQDSPGVKTIRGEHPIQSNLGEARKYSRYPFGLTEGQMDLLLKQRGQPSVLVK